MQWLCMELIIILQLLGKNAMSVIISMILRALFCENNDKFAIDRMLPKIEIGDYLIIHDTGAHGFSMGYNYNGKLKSAELLLKENGEVQLIRREQTPADYFATFDCFEIGKKLLGENETVFNRKKAFSKNKNEKF